MVLVHETTTWASFIKALSSYARALDTQRLTARGSSGPCVVAGSPASALLGDGLLATGGGSGGGEASPVGGKPGAPDPASACIHLALLPELRSGALASAPSAHLLSLLVLDPAGAVFSDPAAVRALAAALAASAQPASTAPSPLPSPQGRGASGPLLRPRLQLASALGSGDWGPITCAFGRLGATATTAAEAEAARSVATAVIEAARLQYAQYGPLFCSFVSYARPASGCLCHEQDCPIMAMDACNLSPRLPCEGSGNGAHGRATSLQPGASSEAGLDAVPCVSPASGPGPQAPLSPVQGPSGAGEPPNRSRCLSDPAVVPAPAPYGASIKRFTSGSVLHAAPPDGHATLSVHHLVLPGSGGLGLHSHAPGTDKTSTSSIGAVRLGTAQSPLRPAGSAAATGSGAVDPALAAAPSSDDSIRAGTSSESHVMLSYAVEAARRYSALLEAGGRWAAAAGVLAAATGAAAERWGHRSAAVGAVLSQVARLEAMQGLHKAAELTWQQAIEALERAHAPTAPPLLLARLHLATVLTALAAPKAEDALRSAMAALDAAGGPAAAGALAGRRALAAHLAAAGRWMEAEVLLQGMLQAEEEAPPPLTVLSASAAGSGGGAGGGAGSGLQPGSPRSARGGSGGDAGEERSTGGWTDSGSTGSGAVATTAAVLLERRGSGSVRKSPSASSLLAAAAAPKLAAGPSRRQQAAAEAGSNGARSPARQDSRLRVAWGAGDLIVLPSSDGGGVTTHPSPTSPPPTQTVPSGSHRRSAVMPLPSAGSGSAVRRSSYTPDLQSPGASPVPSVFPVRSVGGRGRGPDPGNADPFGWSGDAALLADAIAAIQRTYGGHNDLYDGVNVKYGDGGASVDLQSVCVRGGGCINSLVEARRLRDPEALYGAAIAVRTAALGAGHPGVLDLCMQYARYVSAGGEHARAADACRTALERFTAAPCAAAAAAMAAVGGNDHPAEVVARQTLGELLLEAGSLPDAAAALTAAVAAAGRLVAAGEMAPADGRRLAALDSLASALWRRVSADALTPHRPSTTSTPSSDAADDTAAAAASAAAATAGSPLYPRAVEAQRQWIELACGACGAQHERLLKGWVALGLMLEGGGDLADAEAAFAAAGEAALHRHGRLSAATKATFRHLQRVYAAQGRSADAQVLGHMYRLNGGLLSRGAATATAG
ncbi:hypothetical protein HYH03_000446 [Edaphochlamys debaryana]|uniref:Uncharacterized protein n=1 Tax=Edaphochlamys debaryana TaxID=47281 RepID=A0A835YFU9_9CHLO|nr:hypothetical protein HYH03_000446 [Edaphochlamys debaryana]|eukprot:KAG2501948.1 hypothetical protein HYH03_000446 [Edaphochlamys debaryana]